jgi:hypothetical protein
LTPDLGSRCSNAGIDTKTAGSPTPVEEIIIIY